jgi:CBS domain-containing protein
MLPMVDVPVLDGAEPIAEALEKIVDSRMRRGLVLDGEALVGLLSVTDLARLLEGRPGIRRRS